MKIDLNINLVDSADIKRLEAKLDLILTSLQIIKRKEDIIMASLDPIRESVAKMTTVIGSVKSLLLQLSQLLKDAIANGASPEEIAVIAAELDAKAEELAAAVVANTPAA